MHNFLHWLCFSDCSPCSLCQEYLGWCWNGRQDLQCRIFWLSHGHRRWLGKVDGSRDSVWWNEHNI